MSGCVVLVDVMMCLIIVLHVQVYHVLLLCTYNVIIHVHYIRAHVYYVFIIVTILVCNFILYFCSGHFLCFCVEVVFTSLCSHYGVHMYTVHNLDKLSLKILL